MTPALVGRLIARRTEVLDQQREIDDWRMGTLISVMMNNHPNRKSGSKQYEPADFFSVPTRSSLMLKPGPMPEQMTREEQAMWATKWKAYYQTGAGRRAFAEA